MTNKTRSTGMVSVALTLALVAGGALAADLDLTGQGGQYAASRAAIRVRGTTGDFAPSTLFVPFILPNDPSTLATSLQANLNSVVVENVGGRPIAAVTTFGVVVTSTVAPRVVAVLGTTDAGSILLSGESNNTINDEGAASRSSSAGSLLPDGTLTVRENFTSTGQSNIGYWNAIQTLGVAPGTQAPNKVMVSTAVNIGNATETALNLNTPTVTGQVQLSTPSTARDPNALPAMDGNLLTGQVHFNGTPTAGTSPATFRGVAVYSGSDNSPVAFPGLFPNGAPDPVNHEAGWTQDAVPLPTTPAGETIADARQTSPVIAVVRTPGPAAVDRVYVAHGIGFSAGTPFNGGSARPILMAVDTIDNPDGSPRLNYVGSNATASTNTILIEGDAVGGVGTQHGRPYDATAPLDPGYADHFVSDLNMKFVDHQGTGGGSSFTNSQFDMNSKGQIAALWVNEGVVPERYEVRVYDPIWDIANQRIAGYTLSAVVTFSGDAPLIVPEAITTIEITPGVLGESSITPISGLAISDNGRVAFVGIKELFSITADFDGDIFTPDTRYIQNTTNALYVWEPTTNSIHEIVTGGQNGDVLADAFPLDPPLTNESIALGFFPVDEASDSYNRDGFSRDGTTLAVNFRSGGNQTVGGVNMELETLPSTIIPAPADTFDDNGGVLSMGAGPTLTERAVRGSVVISLGAFTSVPVCCVGNADKIAPGSVAFADVTAVLANFGGPANPNGTSVGDADCNGAINFADITAVLANFNMPCP